MSERRSRSRPARCPLILSYHAVTASDPADDPYGMDVRPAVFCRQMRLLAALGFRARPIEEWLEDGTALDQDRRWFAITFDDGYQNVFDNALPLCRRLGFRASVYPVISRIGTTGSWPQEGSRRRRFMGWEELRALCSAGWRVGSHGMEHRSLPSLEERRLAWELRRSRSVLEEELGEAATAISYPYGHVNDTVVLAARRAGYRLGLTLYAETPDLFRLPRLEVGRRVGMGRFVLRLLQWWWRGCLATDMMGMAEDRASSRRKQEKRSYARPA